MQLSRYFEDPLETYIKTELHYRPRSSIYNQHTYLINLFDEKCMYQNFSVLFNLLDRSGHDDCATLNGLIRKTLATVNEMPFST